MIDLFKDVADYCRLEVPVAHRLPIAIVGAGGIVDVAHLPAYRRAGLEVVGLTDLDISRARDVADRHDVPRVYHNLDELLGDKAVRVVDIAVPSAAQPDILRRVLAAGHHALAQKPFAPTADVAAELAQLAAAADVVVGVNQQLRFEEGMAAAHRMVELGWIGKVTSFSITVNIETPWGSWPWALDWDRLEIMIHSIHYHDVVRWFLGEPATVFCAAGRTPGQLPRGETRTITVYRYPDDVTAVVHATHQNQTGDQTAAFRIDGDGGAIRGTLGLLYDYPHGRPDTLEVFSRVLPTDGWLPYPVTTRWIPDAFIGTMGSVLAAVADGGEPRSSAMDNVATLRLVEALYRSVDTGEAVQFPSC